MSAAPAAASTTARRLRIAMLAPPYFSIPPSGYGGIEALVADLVDALVDRGHHITLIGAGPQRTRAQRFVSTAPEPPSERLGEPLAEVAHVARAAQVLDGCQVDLVHDHTLAGPLLARGRLVPTVVTVHGPATGLPGDYYRALGRSVLLVSISDAQRAAAPDLRWFGTVHNSVCVASYPFRSDKDDVVLFLGRYHREKGPHLAIDAAREAGLPIVLAGKCSEPCERSYLEQEIAPRLGPGVELQGIADGARKRELLARSCCLIFPIRWDEPFGLVMVEAMACGTPVVALRRGSVPEVVIDGRTGVVVDDPAELAGAIHRARQLDPRDCRAHVEEHFSTAVMTSGYEAAYRQVLLREPQEVLPTAHAGTTMTAAKLLEEAQHAGSGG